MKTITSDRWRYRRRPNSNYHHDDEVGYFALAAAIVRQAVMDYQYADDILKGIKRVHQSSYSNRLASSAEHTKYEVVCFFRSQWYGLLCDIDPNMILKKLGAI